MQAGRSPYRNHMFWRRHTPLASGWRVCKQFADSKNRYADRIRLLSRLRAGVNAARTMRQRGRPPALPYRSNPHDARKAGSVPDSGVFGSGRVSCLRGCDCRMSADAHHARDSMFGPARPQTRTVNGPPAGTPRPEPEPVAGVTIAPPPPRPRRRRQTSIESRMDSTSVSGEPSCETVCLAGGFSR